MVKARYTGSAETMPDGSIKTRQAQIPRAQGRLKSLGVDRALARAGAAEGDLVRIGSFTFEYEPDDQVLTS